MNMLNIISKGNLRTNKSKSILVAISIALTTCLLVSIGILGVKFADGMTKGAIDRAGSHHARYRGIDSKKVDVLNNHVSIDKVGLIGKLGDLSDENMTLSVAHINDAYMEFTNLELAQGELPKKAGEVVVNDAYLENLNLNNSLGSMINLKYYVGDKLVEGEYKLTGITKAGEKSREEKLYDVIISNEEYLKEKGEDATYTGFITVKDFKNSSKNDIKYMINDIANGLEIPEEKVIINDDYLNNIKPDMGIILGQFFAGFIVVMTAIIVIYNIFYFSINSKIKDYGKLRAVGATSKQIKKIILKEGLFLSLIAIPIGLMLGVFLGEVVIGKILGEAIVLFNAKQIIILLIAACSTLFAVVISLIKPMKVAANISPVEAMKYSESAHAKSSRKNYYEQIDLKKLTKINLQRNKKRTITTCLSLSLSAVLFVIVSIMMNAFNPEEMAKVHHQGDFSVSLDNYSFGNNLSYNEDEMPLYNELQLEGLINEEFIDELKAMDGVEEVSKSNRIRAKQISPKMQEGEFNDISSFSKSEVDELNERVKEGSFDTDEYIKNNGIAFSSASFTKEYGNIKLGDKVVFEIFDGKKIIKKEFTVMAIIDDISAYLLPEEVFNMFESNTIQGVSLKVNKENYEQINNYLTSLGEGNKFLSVGKLEDAIKDMKKSVGMTNIIGYGLVSIIFIISLMNFINTLISSALSRKKEFGMLKAIGLSNKQLKTILQREGIFYVMVTFICAIVFGVSGGYIAIEVMKVMGASYARFGIPISVIIFLCALPLIGLIANRAIIKNMNKESVVDIIRYND